jgi:lipopolysaccharide biosynthesis regulator YciM
MAVANLERALAGVATRNEAMLRLGSIRFIQGQPETALKHWSELRQESRDSSLEFLSWLLEAQARVDMDQPQAAIESLRAAVQLRPRASSAVVMLASLLFVTGQAATGEQLTRGLIDEPPSAQGDDPWHTYLEPGAHHWGPSLAAAKAFLQ